MPAIPTDRLTSKAAGEVRDRQLNAFIDLAMPGLRKPYDGNFAGGCLAKDLSKNAAEVFLDGGKIAGVILVPRDGQRRLLFRRHLQSLPSELPFGLAGDHRP